MDTLNSLVLRWLQANCAAAARKMKARNELQSLLHVVESDDDDESALVSAGNQILRSKHSKRARSHSQSCGSEPDNNYHIQDNHNRLLRYLQHNIDDTSSAPERIVCVANFSEAHDKVKNEQQAVDSKLLKKASKASKKKHKKEKKAEAEKKAKLREEMATKPMKLKCRHTTQQTPHLCSICCKKPCHHRRLAGDCPICMPGRFCAQHPTERARQCSYCGTGLCSHGNIKGKCSVCGGPPTCHHGILMKNRCKDCGRGYCPHGLQRRKCSKCKNKVQDKKNKGKEKKEKEVSQGKGTGHNEEENGGPSASV